jgi:hypothetical protein
VVAISLRPLTAHTGGELEALAGRLSEIIRSPDNRIIGLDFPHLSEAYATPSKALESLQLRRQDMERTPTYAALVVYLGHNGRDMHPYGMTSMSVAKPKRLSRIRGPQMAVWLDARRPTAFRGIGRQLLGERLRWLARNPAFTGRVWTVIRPGSRGSMPVWISGGQPLTFEPVDQPRVYQHIDGSVFPRQLFVSTRPIESLRR